MTAADLEAGLRQFTGGDQTYRDPLFRDLTYTEGFRFLMREAGCHWLLGEIWGAWVETPEIRRDPMVFWKLRVNPDRTAVLECVHDTAGPVYWRKELEFTDFPLSEITLYLDTTVPLILLPSEY